jgi:sugar/nucleoside kinase (ribokinase family)
MPEVRPDRLAPVFAAARKAGAKTVLDVVTPGPGDYLPWLEPLLPEVDIFLPNNHEAELITGEKDPLRQAQIFHRLGAGTAIITLGDKGAVLVDASQKLRADAFKTTYVDGAGGGDAFAAGYICGLLQGLDAVGCLTVGSALGASCVTAIGTTTGVFTKGKCEEFLRKNTLRVERL